MFFCKDKKGLLPPDGQNFDQRQQEACTHLCYRVLSIGVEWNFLQGNHALFPADLFFQNIPEQLFILHPDWIRFQYPDTAAEAEHP